MEVAGADLQRAAVARVKDLADRKKQGGNGLVTDLDLQRATGNTNSVGSSRQCGSIRQLSAQPPSMPGWLQFVTSPLEFPLIPEIAEQRLAEHGQ